MIRLRSLLLAPGNNANGFTAILLVVSCWSPGLTAC